MKTLRVLFDTHAFRQQRFGGISHYFAELISRLPGHGVEPVLHMPWIDNEHAVHKGLSTDLGARIVASMPLARRAAYLALAAYDRFHAGRGGYDIFHRTYYAQHVPVRGPCVCTVHDMIPELFPHYFRDGDPHRGKREAVKRSDLVISVSESTTRDLIRLFDCRPEKIVTVPHGIEAGAFADAPRVSHPFRRPYVLFVGLRHRYKGYRRLAEAMVKVLLVRPELSFALVGGGPLSPEEAAVFRRAGVLGRVLQANAAQVALPIIYRDAELFVFPSEYEGFGLPLLESFASGCPVAASRASSFPEVGGDAIEYFDPNSSEDMQAAIERVLASPARAEELRRLGRERVALFTWERTAERTAEAYRRLG